MLGAIMGPLDGSIANVAMPAISHALHSSLDQVEWVLLAYMLVTASTLVLFGRVGDMLGQKRIYLSGFVAFGLGSVACALAPSLAWLVGFRVFQAIGAAMMTTSAQALVVDIFPGSERGRAIGLVGAAVAVGLSVGPVLGGFIVTVADWRWIFLINVPICVAALAFAAWVIKPATPKREGFDVTGAVCSILCLFALSLALSRAHVWGWGSPRIIALLMTSAIAFSIFLFVERRAAYPTLDLSLFSNRLFSMSTLAAVMFYTVLSGMVFILPLTAQTALGDSPLAAGLLLIPLTVLNIAVAPLAGWLSDLVPARYVATAGALAVSAGAFMLSRLPFHPSNVQIGFALVIAGIGGATFNPPNTSAIMGAAPPNRRGIASATMGTARSNGQLLGVAVAGAVYFARAHALGRFGSTYAPTAAYFAVVATLMLGVAVVSWMRGAAPSANEAALARPHFDHNRTA